jgi:prepilin-type N-terminal cleavage/methylation domain-containing protein
MVVFSGGGSLKSLILSGFRPVEKFKKLFNPAFTLAEVLITLGIIGVVAAMTIPTLMAKINERQTVVKVKKAYSTLSNAMRILENDGDIDWANCTTNVVWDYDGDSVKCIDRLAYVLKGSIIKNFSYGYYFTYKLDEEGVDPYIGIQGLDGILYMFNRSLISSYGIFVDVNGKNNGPNEAGQDVFGFFYDNYDNKLAVSLRPMDTYVNYLYDPPIREAHPCHKDNIGIQCTTWIINKGNMDYPTKAEVDNSNFTCNPFSCN